MKLNYLIKKIRTSIFPIQPKDNLGVPDLNRALLNILSDLQVEREKLQNEVVQRTKAELLVRGILKSTVDSIITINGTGIVVSANHATTQLFGYEEVELLGNNINMLMPEPYRSRHDQFISNYRKTHQAKIIGIGREVIGLRKDGSTFPLELSISETSFGTDILFTGILRDISERKASEQAIDAAMKFATKANQSKSEFLANMSHEIRTPLNTLIGLTDVLLETPLNDEQRRYVATIGESGNVLMSIINDVLDLSKIEAQQIEIESIDFDLEAVLDQLCALTSRKAHEKGIEFVIDIDSDIPTHLIGDPHRLRQILINLVSNAIKFTEKGHIKLSIAKLEAGKTSTKLRIAVEDTGIGIDPLKHESIFESFTQAQASITREFGGTGLGLSIVRNLVQLMGGEMTLKSDLGFGSTFVLDITFQHSTQPSGPSELLATDFDVAGKRALIVDDFPGNRLVLRKMLENWGIQAEECSDGETAITLIQKSIETTFIYDLIFLDCRMPRLSGFEVLEYLQEHHLSADTTILMLTSDHRRGDLVRAKQLGVSAYIIKPFKKADIRNAILIAQSSSPTGSILIVDDEPELRKMIKNLLTPLRLKTFFASTGVEALQIIKTHPIDTIISDLRMPDLGGIELLAEVRRGGNSIPFIIVTGFLDNDARAKARDLVVEAILEKPDFQQNLLDVVTKSIREGVSQRKGPLKSRTTSNGKQLTIMIVDDSEKNRDLIEIYLRDSNYNMVTAVNGQEAIDQYQNGHFDLILMDMQMPVIDGYTATRTIRAFEDENKTKAATPIIALTAFALQGEREKSLRAGCNDHLTKPIRKKTLLEAIIKNTGGSLK